MAVISTITEMFAVTGAVMKPQKLSDLSYKPLIQGRRATQIKRESVTDDGKLFRDCPELPAKAATHIDPVFRCHLHKIDLGRQVVCQRAYKGSPQTQSRTFDRSS